MHFLPWHVSAHLPFMSWIRIQIRMSASDPPFMIRIRIHGSGTASLIYSLDKCRQKAYKTLESLTTLFYSITCKLNFFSCYKAYTFVKMFTKFLLGIVEDPDQN